MSRLKLTMDNDRRWIAHAIYIMLQSSGFDGLPSPWKNNSFTSVSVCIQISNHVSGSKRLRILKSITSAKYQSFNSKLLTINLSYGSQS